MVKDSDSDDYWPLGALEYSNEIADSFAEEAQLLGTITILWNRQELALRRIFVELLDTKRDDFAEAIWNRMPTHKARRDTLALALDTGKLTKRQRGILTWIIDNTKRLADRRNDLIHAEYVVQHRTDSLHAKVKSPRSKMARHQKVSCSDLQAVIDDLDRLVMATEGAMFEFAGRKLRRLNRTLDKFLKERSSSH